MCTFESSGLESGLLLLFHDDMYMEEDKIDSLLLHICTKSEKRVREEGKERERESRRRVCFFLLREKIMSRLHFSVLALCPRKRSEPGG